ncbi:MAG: VTT domain-containing protein [Micropruina sp.]|nr:VTT domain-containing protein [Micropruina sp.]
MARANATYWLGRLAVAGAERTPAARLMASVGYRRAVDRLNTWGAPAVSLSFLTIGIQTLINLAAGATRMPLLRYLPAVTLGSVIWAFLYATVGFAGMDALSALYSRSPGGAVALGLASAGLLAFFIVVQFRRRTHD